MTHPRFTPEQPGDIDFRRGVIDVQRYLHLTAGDRRHKIGAYAAICTAPHGVAATPYPADAHMGCSENCARHSPSAM